MIEITLEDENGKTIERLEDPKNYFNLLLASRDTTDTNFLRFIDPYGDTTFNSLQIPFFIKELKELLKLSKNKEFIDYGRKVLELAEKARTHIYLKFYGD